MAIYIIYALYEVCPRQPRAQAYHSFLIQPRLTVPRLYDMKQAMPRSSNMAESSCTHSLGILYASSASKVRHGHCQHFQTFLSAVLAWPQWLCDNFVGDTSYDDARACFICFSWILKSCGCWYCTNGIFPFTVAFLVTVVTCSLRREHRMRCSVICGASSMTLLFALKKVFITTYIGCKFWAPNEPWLKPKV